jgi:hypothetical protein
MNTTTTTNTTDTIFGVPFAEFHRQLAPVQVSLPAGTEAHVCWGEIVFSSWEPSRRLTRQDVADVAEVLVAAGCGTATAASAARRWSKHWGEEFAPEPGGRKPRPTPNPEPLSLAIIGEDVSLAERRPALYD